MKHLLVLLFSIALVFPITANARLTILCGVSAGGSDPYIRSVEFINGEEYAKARGDFIGFPFDAYALIWFSQEQVAILKIKSFFVSSSDRFGLDDLNNLFMISDSVLAEQVNGNSGRLWRITCKKFFEWIDPRLKDFR
jgi:hypothetical protein